MATTSTEITLSARSASRMRLGSWTRRYVLALSLADTIAVGAGVWFGSAVQLTTGSPPGDTLVFAAGLAVVWLALLQITGSRARKEMGWGPTEYRRVASATAYTFMAALVVAYAVPVDDVRLLLLSSGPSGLLLLFVGRRGLRGWLHRERRSGRMTRRVVLVGSPRSMALVAQDLLRAPHAGLRVVATRPIKAKIARDDVAEARWLKGLTTALEDSGADTVVVTGANEVSAAQMRRLSWALEPGRQHLVVAPSLTDVSGPRVHTRPVAGLPLLHIETPRFEGGTLVVKRVFDIVVAGTLLVLLSPALAVLASAVRSSGPGGILYRQQRIGRNGATFDMLKFRSMNAGADRMVDQLDTGERDAGNAVLFKMKDDPRVTRIGRVLRRYSLDELPQLINVLRGDMSLVGPRPPLEREVAAYADHVHRRFLVKPGITGLWQVSGRSDLSWEESVRLDLYYVENWSLMGDIVILWKTARAVVSSDGAY